VKDFLQIVVFIVVISYIQSVSFRYTVNYMQKGKKHGITQSRHYLQ